MMTYSHRNGESEPPEVSPDEFSRYWFQGEADYENWEQRGKMIVPRGGGTDDIADLVYVTMGMDFKRIVKDGDRSRCRPIMLPYPEHAGYDLGKCRGRWWGPVHVPIQAE